MVAMAVAVAVTVKVRTCRRRFLLPSMVLSEPEAPVAPLQEHK